MNNYQIYDEIGRGRHSIVYKGRRKRSVEYYAISSIERSERQRVIKAVHFLRAMNHPNVLRFHNWYETNNHLWLILELCTGGSLREVLSSLQAPLPESAIRVYALGLVSGLLHLHRQGVLYVDLKPSNLLLDEDAMVRYYDFGRAVHVTAAAPDSGAVGAPAYMAPELLTRGAPPSYASDLWSLGCVLFELAAGAPPFVGSVDGDASIAEIVERVATGPSPTLSANIQRSRSLDDLIARLLDREPARRATWPEVLQCAFLRRSGGDAAADLESARTLPAQPAYERWLAAQPPPDPTPLKGPSGIDAEIARASMNATANLARDAVEAEGEDRAPQSAKKKHGRQRSYRDGPDAANRITADMELDFRDPAAARPAVTPPTVATRPSSAAVVDSGAAPPMTAAPVHLATEVKRPLSRQLSDSDSRAPTSTTIEGILVHPSDTYVKPIVLNSRIEKHVPTQFEAGALGFPARTAAELAVLQPSALESFFGAVDQAFRQAQTQQATLHILAYISTITVEPDVANLIVDSSLMQHVTAALEEAALLAPAIHAEAAMVVGLLFRHATFIHSDLQRTRLLELLSNHCRNTSDQGRVRRKATAALGEFIFYVAAQTPEERAPWRLIPESVFAAVVTALTDEDEVVRHYAVKAVENVVTVYAESGDEGPQLARHLMGPQVVEALLETWMRLRGEHIRASALHAAVAIASRVPGTLTVFECVRGGVPGLICDALQGGSARGVQAVLTFLNAMLARCVAQRRADNDHVVAAVPWYGGPAIESIFSVENPQYPAFSAASMDLAEQLGVNAAFGLITSLSRILEHSNAVLRVKALVAVLLLLCSSPRFCLRSLSKRKFLTSLDKAVRVDTGCVVSASLRRVVALLTTRTIREAAAADDRALPELLQRAATMMSSDFIRSCLSPADVKDASEGIAALVAHPALEQEGEVAQAAGMLCEAAARGDCIVGPPIAAVAPRLAAWAASDRTSEVLQGAALQSIQSVVLRAPHGEDRGFLRAVFQTLGHALGMLLARPTPIPLLAVRALNALLKAEPLLESTVRACPDMPALLARALAPGHSLAREPCVQLLDVVLAGGGTSAAASAEKAGASLALMEILREAISGEQVQVEAPDELVLHTVRSLTVLCGSLDPSAVSAVNDPTALSTLLAAAVSPALSPAVAALAADLVARICRAAPQVEAQLLEAPVRRVLFDLLPHGDCDAVGAVQTTLLRTWVAACSRAHPEALVGMCTDDLLLARLDAAHTADAAAAALLREMRGILG